jgi:hypothetical protein
MLMDSFQKHLSTKKERYFWLSLLGLFIFLSLNRHSKAGINNYHSEIWADKAGYYIYLPATFIYGWHTERLPEQIDIKTGQGFRVMDNQTILTKYTYGVALFEFPFFISNYVIQSLTGGDLTGFGASYARSISIAGSFWLTWGLYLFSMFLRNFIPSKLAITYSMILLTGSNLLYYGIIDGGMSHVYSFFLFASLLHVIIKIKSQGTRVKKILIGLIIGLIVIVRPINLLFLAFGATAVIFIKFISVKEIIRLAFSPHVLMMIALCVIPQTFYWDYSFGQAIVFSYEGESFDHFIQPPIHKFLFAPHNGLFAYSPLWFLFFLPLSEKGISRITLSHITGFVLIVYVFSSWWNWNFGCGFGCRTLCEYSTVFSLPFFILNSQLILKNRLIQIAILLFILINLKLTFSYDQCWQGTDWDWQQYIKILLGPTK